MKKTGKLMIAFPKKETELRVVFSEPVDQRSAQDPSNYKTRSGLKILEARVDRDDPRRVSLTTDPMNGEAMNIDVLSAPGVRTSAGQPLARTESPEFIQGFASIPEVNKPGANEFPFASRFVGKIASESCGGKDGGVDSSVLIDTFGFAFIHMETGGPFNSAKIVTKGHIEGIAEITRTLRAGQTPHVLWAGGEIRNVNGETHLVDTGYMEGSVIPPTPLRSPPPFLIKTKEIAGKAGRTLRAKSLQGVVVRFENVKIDKVSEPNKSGLRYVVFHDDSDEPIPAVFINTVITALRPGQELVSLRGLLHYPNAGEAEVIVELDQHLVLGTTELFGNVILVEGYSLPGFHGCHALVALRDTPGRTVAVLTEDHRLQTLLETALQTGALIAFWGTLLSAPSAPRGGTWSVDVYQIDGVIVYDRP